MEGTCYKLLPAVAKEITINNCKNTLNDTWFKCLHLDSQSCKIVRKFYLSYPARLLIVNNQP